MGTARTTESVKSSFSAEHRQMDDLLANYQALKRKDHAAAKQNFKGFLTLLRRHIVWEEEVLFPAFETKTGAKRGGPTEVMRLEHREIKSRLDALHDFVRMADPESDAAVKALMDILKSHNHKEEGILYPEIDSALSPEEMSRARKDMAAIPAERFANCCQNH